MTSFSKAALLVAIAGIFIPYGFYLTIISAILASFSYRSEIPIAGLAIVINFINIHILSPFLVLAISSSYNRWMTMADFVNILSFIQIIPLLVIGFLLIKNRETKKPT